MVPKLLMPDSARELTDKIYSQTGCFPFFNPNKYILAGSPGAEEDSFYYIVNGLYILYHDFGKSSLIFFLMILIVRVMCKIIFCLLVICGRL